MLSNTPSHGQVRTGPRGEESPLDPAMWDPAATEAAWEHHGGLKALEQLPNVAEWRESTDERRDGFEALVGEVGDDLARWQVEPAGAFPSGVGGITVAGHHQVHGDVVAKWVAEVGDAGRVAAMCQALADVEAGPQVLGRSRRGVLSERVRPGVPLRCYRPEWGNVVAVAGLWGTVRHQGCQVDGFDPADPVADHQRSARESAGRYGDDDGFAARAVDAWQAVADAHRRGGNGAQVGHGDLQLGNALVSAGSAHGLALVDGWGMWDRGGVDLGRLACHCLVDAAGCEIRWDAGRLVGEVARAGGDDEGLVALATAAHAASTALYIRRQVPDRQWEWQAADRLCVELARLGGQ